MVAFLYYDVILTFRPLVSITANVCLLSRNTLTWVRPSSPQWPQSPRRTSHRLLAKRVDQTNRSARATFSRAINKIWTCTRRTRKMPTKQRTNFWAKFPHQLSWRACWVNTLTLKASGTFLAKAKMNSTLLELKNIKKRQPFGQHSNLTLSHI